MRPHVLELQAFGPFAGRERVDFDDLGSAGLLLLHGDTGAGKTSVLDALGFALYGEVPGERGLRGLRSEHADPAVETEVRLEFTAGGRRWRVRRWPQQQVAKQRGRGTTTRKPGGLLERLDGEEWTPVATRLDEIGLTVKDAVGLTGQQFFQVVLLPQGRFAAFLHASADARQALLRQLFGTERFTDIERLLKDWRSALAEQTAQASREIAAQLDAVVAAAGADIAERVGGRPAGEASEAAAEWSGGVLVALTAALEAAEGAVEVAEQADASAADALLDAQALASRQQRRAAALAAQSALLARADEVERARAELAGARAAAPLGPTLDRLDARCRERAALADRVAAEAARLAAILPVPAGEPGDQFDLFSADGGAGRLPRLDAVLDRERALRDAAAAARPALAVEADLDRAAVEVERLTNDIAATDAVLASRRDALLRTDEAMAAAGAELATAEQLAARRPELTSLAEVAARAAAAAAELAPARSRTATARAAYDAARAAALDARERWLDLASRRLTGMAAELARGLADGQPCAVCGATEHPAPAAPADDAVGEDDERAARAAADRAEADVELLRRAAEDAATQVAAVEAALGVRPGAMPDVAALRATAVAAADAAAAATAAAQRLTELAATARTRVAERADAAAAVTAAEAKAASLATELAAARAAVADRAATVAVARAGEARVADRVARLDADADRLAELAAALRAEQALADEVADLADELVGAARTAGFAGVEDARRARRTAARVAALDASVRAYDEDVAATAARLADADLDVDLDPPADVDAARAAAAAAKAALTEAVAARAAYEHRCATVRVAAGRIAELDRELRPRLAELANVQALAELASGGAGNRLRMSLTSFVLAARLEAVAARASVRLSRMTSGRFSLVHTDEVVDGRQRSGLGLAVRDVWTGTERPTSSLSGGETFMTALALALGLADVVAEEAGGRRIDTLFVDEGFGTLDDASLDLVVDVLDDLRDGGRLVGIVSHVAELRRRVPARLEVIRGRAGSTLRACPAPVYD